MISAYDQVFSSFLTAKINYSSKPSNIIKIKVSQRNCHIKRNLKETRKLNVMWYPKWYPRPEKEHSMKTNKI